MTSRKKKQICKRGHDTFICGRTKVGTCKDCKKQDAQKRYIPHPKIKNPICINGHNKDITGRDGQGKCKECRRLPNRKQQTRQYTQSLRLDALQAYSNVFPSCVCCGIKVLEFLGIDHIAGGGNQHRKSISGNFYAWLKKNNYPKGFQVLCYNCNLSLGFYGYCPHSKINLKPQRAREDFGQIRVY